ncbi:juvenile hormone esterase [Manduca sexta]|uniref:juvenile hormone esterase n=1 Tax=Manduca sexta TaxID=7130 RepID=UPI00188E825C|nr:juvenile hormone esterase [Manduca sexta]
MYVRPLIICVVLVNVQSQGIQETRIVNIDQGPVRGFKKPGAGYYSFYNMPYATIRERFKAASPPPTWTTPFDAVDRGIICPQAFVPYVNSANRTMQEDCLVINVFVPETNETNLPVLVDVHGGAFHAGLGDAFTYNKFATLKNVIVVTYNYRVGILGFICMGTENIPGNAGMKDVVTGLRWVQRNIASFGGNPNDVTLTGCSAGGTAIDLLILSNSTKGLFKRVITDSGSNLAAYAIQPDPIEMAKQDAMLYNFTDVDNLDALEQFFLTEPYETFTRTSSNCGPCVEKDLGQEMFLHEAPYTILNRGDFIKYPTMYGLTDMEGLFYFNRFEELSQQMDSNFSNFLPNDLQFSSEGERQRVAESVKYFYFGNGSVSGNLKAFVDYQSDVVFVYSILRTVQLNVHVGHRELYLYEYSYYDDGSLGSPSLCPSESCEG